MGFITQELFSSRLIIPWLLSEKHSESNRYMVFGILSNVRSLLILAYVIIRKNPVLFKIHMLGISINSCDLILLKNQND